jgi:hypothetical protein
VDKFLLVACPFVLPSFFLSESGFTGLKDEQNKKEQQMESIPVREYLSVEKEMNIFFLHSYGMHPSRDTLFLVPFRPFALSPFRPFAPSPLRPFVPFALSPIRPSPLYIFFLLNKRKKNDTFAALTIYQ